MYSGKQKLAFSQRLEVDWRKLLDYFDINDHLETGDEPSAIWEWLKRRNKLAELPEALAYIDRNDIVVDILQPTDTTAVEVRSTWTDPPYPGLRHFTERDAPIFFGRKREADELLKRLRHDSLIAVVGASGSGKSSLVAAGVLPRLHEIMEGQRWRSLNRFTPGELRDDPFEALAVQLRPGLEHRGLTTSAITKKLHDTGHLAVLADQYRNDGDPEAPLLVFIDQFEELFTLTRPEHQRRFLATLVRAARSPRLRIVLTLRADFYHRCVEHPRMAELLRSSSYPLAAPEPPALLEMITGPAAVAGLDFEDGLPGRILRDTGNEPGALALMAFALEALYLACQPGKTLTKAAYENFGGVQGVIGKRAEDAFDTLAPAAQARLGDVFRDLVEVDERNVATRRRAPLDRLTTTTETKQLVSTLIKARLLVTSRSEDDNAMVEVAHEALFRSWPRLAEWIQETADDHHLRRQITQLAAYWDAHQRKDEHRWLDDRVAEVVAMQAHLGLRTEDFSAQERDFLGPIDRKKMLAELDDPATDHERRAIIGVRLSLLGDPRPGVGLREDGLPDIVWCEVPGGTVTLEDDAGTFPVEPFCIAKYPITYQQYRVFLEAGDGFEKPDRPGRQLNRRDNHPAENLAWVEAIAFCRWLSEQLGEEIGLPTEWQWQQAATGGDPTREYPWPGTCDGNRANTLESELSRSTAVGLYPQGASPVGSLDMVGNVWEWCLNEYENPEQTGLSGTHPRVVRGGSWLSYWNYSRAAFRYYVPGGRGPDLGFRVVRRPPS